MGFQVTQAMRMALVAHGFPSEYDCIEYSYPDEAHMLRSIEARWPTVDLEITISHDDGKPRVAVKAFDAAGKGLATLDESSCLLQTLVALYILLAMREGEGSK